MKHTEETKKKMSKARKGKPAWNKGLKGYRAGIPRVTGLFGEKSPSWKGEKVGYRGLHIWVQMMLGKPEYCTKCGIQGNGHNMHWANISGEYRRDITDWIRLCAKCHGKFDKEKGVRKH